MRVEYGPVSADIENWNWPSTGLFERWKADLLNLPESREYDIFLLGGFLETLAGKQESTPDIDIILAGPDNPESIRKLIVEGTRLGIEKYQMFVDILWFDQLPVYAECSDPQLVRMYLIADEWRVDGEVRKKYNAARQLESGLWELQRTFPTKKQRARIESGFTYSAPRKISSADPNATRDPVTSIEFPPFTHTLQTVLACPWLLSANPVIAGGFPTAIYHVLQSLDSADDWSRFEARISCGDHHEITGLHGDIDCYFHDSDPVWHQGIFRGLVTEQQPLPENSGLESCNPAGNSWARACKRTGDRHGTPIQCIKHPVSSVTDCLVGFDLVNCAIAWFDNRVYVHREFEDAYLNQEIRANKSGFLHVYRRDLYGQLFSANRIFKYAKRYNCTLSEELSTFVQSLGTSTESYDDLEDPDTVNQLLADFPITNPATYSWLAPVLGRFRTNLAEFSHC